MTENSKKLIIFDKDGTLTPSKSPIEPDMADLIVRLLERKKIAIISGGGFYTFETQLLQALPGASERYVNLFLLPASGTQLYVWRGSWRCQYAENLNPREKEKIMIALNAALRAASWTMPAKIYGQLIEDRGSQITFSGLGQNAPLELKIAWDPTREKREKIAAILKEKIPECDIRIGGTTSIDVTRRGVNKGYGIRKLEEYLKMPMEEMVFVGDALFHGGNDYPVKATGVDCVQVSGPEETKKYMRGWLA